MSRYQLQHKENNNLEIFVGWDDPMKTFFCCIEDLSVVEEEKDPIILWVGNDYDAIKDVRQLQQNIQDYVTLEKETITQLEEDKRKGEETFEQSPMQKLMEDFSHRLLIAIGQS